MPTIGNSIEALLDDAKERVERLEVVEVGDRCRHDGGPGSVYAWAVRRSTSANQVAGAPLIFWTSSLGRESMFGCRQCADRVADRDDVRRRAVAMSCGRCFGREEVRQFVGAVGESEHRAVRLEGEAGFERPGIDRVEAESVDELHHRVDRGGVVAGRGDGDAVGCATRTPAFVELVVAAG